MNSLRALVMLPLLLLGAMSALAEDFPARPIKVLVAYPAGGAADLITRAVLNELSTTAGYQVVVENRGGGATQIATEAMLKSPADGYTLLATGMETLAINPFIYAKLSYDPKDLVAVSGLAYSHQMLVVPAKSLITSIQDLVARAKAATGQLQYGTIGVGGSSHINMVLFENLAGVKLTPVHYRGGAPMLNDLLGGHIPMGFLSVTLVHAGVDAGTLRPLGVGSLARLPQFPNVPTIDESGVKGYEAVSWFGLFAPHGTPEAVVRKLNADIQTVFAKPAFRKRFLDPNFLEPIAGTPEQFSAYISKEQAKWKNVVETAHLHIE